MLVLDVFLIHVRRDMLYEVFHDEASSSYYGVYIAHVAGYQCRAGCAQVFSYLKEEEIYLREKSQVQPSSTKSTVSFQRQILEYI